MTDDGLSRRDLLLLGAGAGALAACIGRDTGGAGDLDEVTIGELQDRMHSGRESAASLVEKYTRRIAATNTSGPMLRAVLQINPEAMAIAERLDTERERGSVRGPLHGIPILIKDNIDTGDAQLTSSGSLALARPALGDAFAVARLREAGAVILGKANLSEWANFRGTASSSGWSARVGQCRNPYALDRSPSGSSSGSAVAVAANLCAVALGTETDGSIVSPSSCNGLVGVKPTVGLVSRAGVIPIASSQDTIGPMARTVTDAAIVLGAIAGHDPADPQSVPRAEDYTRYLTPRALAGARLGVPRKGFFGNNRNVDAVMTEALAKLKELGAELVDPADLVAPPDLAAAEIEVFLYELKATLGAYLGERGATLADIIAFNKGHADRELGLFGQEYFEAAAAKGSLADQAYRDARAKCIDIARTRLLDKVMSEQRLDAFVAATNGPAWLIDPVNGDGYTGVSCSSLPAISGYPHVTVLGGRFRGLPIGLSFFGAPFTEGKLLGYAFAWELATGHRAPPRFLRTVEL